MQRKTLSLTCGLGGSGAEILVFTQVWESDRLLGSGSLRAKGF